MFSHIECLSYLNMGYSGEENRTVVFIPKLSPATLLKNRIFKCPSTLTLPLLGPMHTPHTVVAVVFQSPCHVQLFVTPRTAARQASLSFTTSWSLLKLVHWVGDAIQPSHPLSSPSLPTFSLSQHQGVIFQMVSFSHRMAKILEFQLSIFLAVTIRTDFL